MIYSTNYRAWNVCGAKIQNHLALSQFVCIRNASKCKQTTATIAHVVFLSAHNIVQIQFVGYFFSHIFRRAYQTLSRADTHTHSFVRLLTGSTHCCTLCAEFRMLHRERDRYIRDRG